MELLHQPFDGQLGNRLIDLLDSRDFETLNVIVAFAKNSGVLRIKDAFERFRNRGGTINVYVGIDLTGTSYEALTTLLVHVDSLNIVHAENGQTFHTKIYNLVGGQESLIIVGSNNLTAGGLWTNVETSTLIPIRPSVPREVDMQRRLDQHMNTLATLGASFKQIHDQAQIDELLNQGYLLKEVAGRARRLNSTTTAPSRSRLFGNGVPAHLPTVTTPAQAQPGAQPAAATAALGAASSAPGAAPSAGAHSPMPSTPSPAPGGPASSPPSGAQDKGETIWFETRAMTGGSRNILDLSRKSLVASGNPVGTAYEHQDRDFMLGGVEFFDVDPADIAAVKPITINFDGIDYAGNTILFGRSNGTWRLQIRGVDDAGNKITERVKAIGGEGYLTHKILTFTKVESDYYSMSVLPMSQLDSLKSASWLVAYNGSTVHSRWLGVL